MGNQPTPTGAAFTELVLEIFRLNGRLLAAGDRLVAPLGLTSARWQVLGAVAMAERPESVAGLARGMGLNRQGVQRIVDEMQTEGWFAFAPNPQHRRAKLVVLTEGGRDLYDRAASLQVPWAEAIAAGLALDAIAEATRLLRELRDRLSADGS